MYGVISLKKMPVSGIFDHRVKIMHAFKCQEFCVIEFSNF